jgi:hypothetical protein
VSERHIEAQPGVVWINEPPDDTTVEKKLLFQQVTRTGADSDIFPEIHRY